MSDQEITTTEAPPENPTPLAELTWDEVIKKFFVFLKSENKGKQERNFKTAIKIFLESIGLTEESVVGSEVTEEFETKIGVYIEFQINRGIGKSTYGPRVSKIKALKIFVEQNFEPRLRLQTLPKTFGHKLYKLITALWVTVKSFWQTLPKGLLSYDTLCSWCRERNLPSTKFRQTVRVIEDYLEVPRGTLRLPQYPQRGHILEPGQSDSGNKARAAISKPYWMWTESLEQEFQELFIHKTIAILPEGEERNEEGQWTSNEDGEVPTAEIAMQTIKSFAGFCALPAESPDPYLRGAGIKINHLSLALFADKTLVEKFLDFMKLRSGLRVKQVDEATAASLPEHQISANGLWEYYDKGGKYNDGSIRFLSFVSGLLHPETGYLYQHPEYAEKLGKQMTAVTWEEQCGATRERVDKIRKNIRGMKKKVDSRNFDFGRDPKERIQWILDLPRPLLMLQEMIKAIVDDLLPDSATAFERARQYRDLILVALLCANPLRVAMFSRLKFDENLIRLNDGSWWLKFRREAFKNRRALKCDYHVRIAEDLWSMLDRYREEFHPILVGSTGSKYVLVGRGKGRHVKRSGAPLSETSLSNIVQQLTELYLPGGLGFRAHAFRHIIATDIIRKDPRLGFFIASRALHDKLETVEKEYIHMKTSEYFEPVNMHFSEAWRLVFKSSQAFAA